MKKADSIDFSPPRLYNEIKNTIRGKRMKMRRLCASDYDELLSMLNATFRNKYGREVDFLTEQPKMWVRDDEHMGRHLGIFEDGRLVSVAGIYPLPTVIAGEGCMFMTTGNVATLPGYEGRGYFTKIFSELMRELESVGADAARLGGARQRYARYGFESCGSSYRVEYNEINRVRCFGESGADIEFSRVLPSDFDSLKFITEIISKKPFYVTRGGADTDEQYRALTTKHSLPYIATRGGVPIGYLSASEREAKVGSAEWGELITESGAVSEDIRIEIINAWQKKLGKNISFTIAAHEQRLLSSFGACAEIMTLGIPSHFKIINFERITNALMKLKASYTDMPRGEATLCIKDYGTLLLYNTGMECGCVLTDKSADFTVDKMTAARLLYGPLLPTAFSGVPHNLAAFLPLPLSWNTLDYT